ncbi:MAG: spore coat protein [Caldicoprobacterales bacterium]|jgi:spore coat protein CotF|nr:spore coat protein [Clostridiales bacterium]
MTQNQGIGDKELATLILNNHKLSANSLNNLVLESVNPNLRQDVTQILYRTYQHQKMIWDYMNSKGYYQVEAAQPQEIAKAQQKFQQTGMQQ